MLGAEDSRAVGVPWDGAVGVAWDDSRYSGLVTVEAGVRRSLQLYEQEIQAFVIPEVTELCN